MFKEVLLSSFDDSFLVQSTAAVFNSFILVSPDDALLGSITISSFHSNGVDAIAVARIPVPVKRLASIALAERRIVHAFPGR